MKAYPFSLAHKSKLFTKKPWFSVVEKQKPSVNSFFSSVKRKKTAVKNFTTSINSLILSVKKKISLVKTLTASVNGFLLAVKRKTSSVKKKHTALPIQISWMQL